MPRDGSNIYSQPDPDVVADTTIESAKYNNFTNDIAQDLNLPRPIVAGGTGATSASGARSNMDAEVAGAQVTNYNSHVFEAGSFWSAIAATGAPNSTAIFGGICIVPNDDQNVIILQAWDTGTGLLYTRNKASGIWGAWVSEDDTYVNVAGDAMSGNLSITKATPLLFVNKLASGQAALVTGAMNGLNRWSITLPGDTTAETGSSAGSNFDIASWNDAGTLGTSALSINRLSRLVTAAVGVSSPFFTSTSGNFSCQALAGQNGNLYFNDETTAIKFQQYWNRSTNTFTVHPTGASTDFTIDASGIVGLGVGFLSRPGQTGPTGTSRHNFNWVPSTLQAWVDFSNIGNVTVTSDYRTKKDVMDLPNTWEMVKSLRPIKYTQAQYTPKIDLEARAKSGEDTRPPMFAADSIERWGFLAHELQETLIESASTGYKDAPDVVQSPNPFTLIAALTKALQEAMMRIEALEAR